MGRTTEEIRVEANTKPMAKGLKEGEDRLKQFQSRVGNISAQVGTISQFATGFGLLGVFSQVSGLIDGVEAKFKGLEDAALMRGVRGRGAIQGGRAEQLAQLAARAPRASGGIDFATLSSTLEGGVLKLGSWGAAIVGATDTAKRLDLALSELAEQTIANAEETGALREGLSLLAEAVALNEAVLKNAAAAAEVRVRDAGIGTAGQIEFRAAAQAAIQGGQISSQFALTRFVNDFINQKNSAEDVVGVAIAAD